MKISRTYLERRGLMELNPVALIMAIAGSIGSKYRIVRKWGIEISTPKGIIMLNMSEITISQGFVIRNATSPSTNNIVNGGVSTSLYAPFTKYNKLLRTELNQTNPPDSLLGPKNTSWILDMFP